jgi:hypothetical protein
MYCFTSPGFIPQPVSSWMFSNFTVSIASPTVAAIAILANSAGRAMRYQSLPPLAGLQSSLWIEVEKNFVPTMGDHPIADRDGLCIVGARMGEKDA